MRYVMLQMCGPDLIMEIMHYGVLKKGGKASG